MFHPNPSCYLSKSNTGSTFLCLKITLFLCFHIFPTIVNHIPCQNLFCLLLRFIRWKCWKLSLALTWCTKLTPTHLSHIFHTFWDTLHEKNRCSAFSSLAKHISHRLFCNWTPFAASLTFVGNLSRNNLHPNSCAFGATLIIHNVLNSLFPSSSKEPCNLL